MIQIPTVVFQAIRAGNSAYKTSPDKRVNPSPRSLGPQQKINPHLACLLARLLRYIHRHVSRYAPLDVPCRRTQSRRNLVELFLTVTLNDDNDRWCLFRTGRMSAETLPGICTDVTLAGRVRCRILIIRQCQSIRHRSSRFGLPMDDWRPA